jgi:hypothetical protein
MTTDKVQENYYRRWAKRLGLILQKSRAKKWSWNDEGGYRLVEDHDKAVALGPNWELTLEDVNKSLALEEERRKRAQRKLQNG